MRNSDGARLGLICVNLRAATGCLLSRTIWLGKRGGVMHAFEVRRFGRGTRSMVRRLSLFALALAAAVLSGGVALSVGVRAEEGGRPGTPFILMDHNGRTVTDQDFSGYVRLVYFGYAHCPDVCPTTLQTMSVVLDLLGPDADRVRPLFVTVDPQRDTVSLLRQYMSSFDRRIVALTGSPEMIERIARGYGIKYERAEGGGIAGYSIDHTASVLLLGPEGEYAGRLAHGASAEEITKSVRGLLESFPRQGSARARFGR